MSVNLKENIYNGISNDFINAIEAATAVAQNCNIKIFLIGGIVRDLILNRPIKDIDITVEANAVEFCKLLEEKSFFTIESIQENLRTAKARFRNGVIIDFASTREEKYPIAGNLPIAFNFGCELKKDVARRDFTVNTLAISLNHDDKYFLIDYYNGYDDIFNKQIKILHKKSFTDDPSRIIRALKFMVRLNFNIENETLNIMNTYLSNVDMTIPLERIKNELLQYFSIAKGNIYQTIIETQAYKLVSDNPVKSFNKNLFNETLSFLKKEQIKFIYFFLLIYNSDLSVERLNLTVLEKKTISDIKALIKNVKSNYNNNYEIYDTFRNKTDMAILVYYICTGDNAVKKYFNELKDIKIEVTGKDLIALGLKPSPYFSRIFEQILFQKLNGNLINKEEEINFIKQIKKE